MCLEDLRMGRKKYTRVKSIPVDSSGNVPLVPASKYRVLLRINTDVDSLNVAPTDLGANAALGFRLSAANPDFEIDIDRHGDIVTSAWVGSATIATNRVTIMEVFYDDKGDDL